MIVRVTKIIRYVSPLDLEFCFKFGFRFQVGFETDNKDEPENYFVMLRLFWRKKEIFLLTKKIPFERYIWVLKKNKFYDDNTDN